MTTAHASAIPQMGALQQLTERNIGYLRQLFKSSLPPDTPVYLYGSRARYTHRWNSDFDFWIDAPLTRERLSALEDAIDDSFLPFHVDIVASPLVAGRFEREVRQGAQMDVKLAAWSEAVKSFGLLASSIGCKRQLTLATMFCSTGCKTGVFKNLNTPLSFAGKLGVPF